MRLVFDAEADGFLEHATRVWCIVTKDIDTGRVERFYHNVEKPQYNILRDIDKGLEYLSKAEVLIGHNIIGYDLPLFKKLYNFEYTGELIDTLVVSRALKSDRPLPRGYIGNKTHSLEAWGYRVGRGKPEHNDWSQFSMDMLYRCNEDVEINELVYHALEKEKRE